MSGSKQTDVNARILRGGGANAANKGRIRILGIETSCETAIAILNVRAMNRLHNSTYSRMRFSQIEIHREYGGVFPALAKREHAKNLVPILEATLEEAELLHEDAQVIPDDLRAKIAEMLAREPGLTETFFEFISQCEPPEIDAIAVTAGPGLEPALWVGINFAKALALVWNKPLIAVNHMEGHVRAALASRYDVAPGTGEHDAKTALASGNHVTSPREDHDQRTALASGNHVALASGVTDMLEIKDVRLPILALLISGGHTELVLMRKWLEYELIGETRDDAVGEAFDKVARMLGLPYPGGTEISRLAELVRSAPPSIPTTKYSLPRPMLHDATCDFSFAGLKTAVLYLLKKYPEVNDREKQHIAHEFEDAVTDVLWKKTSRALEETGAQTLVIGGGVSANTHIRRTFTVKIKEEHPEVALRIPSNTLTTDNAIMIALSGFYRAHRKEFVTDIVAAGNLPLA